MAKERSKTWGQKVDLVTHSFMRSYTRPAYAKSFYDNLFFLSPKLRDYFTKTDFEHQEKALLKGLEYLIGFLGGKDDNARQQVLRIAQTHAKNNMNIHPHSYYYWIEAMILTTKDYDEDWFDDLEYYWREVLNYPVTFIISQFFNAP